MQQQLQRMRNLTTYIDRPSYTQHFSSDEPFFDSPPPEYSFIGNALLSLATLSRKMSSVSTAPIFCRYTAEAIGSCRVDIKIVNIVLSSKFANFSSPPTRSSSPAPSTVPPGSKLSFFLTIDQVKGLSSQDFRSIHLQVRLSSFFGPTLAAEEVFPSATIDFDSCALSELKFRRAFTIVTTSKVLNHLRQGYAPIEFFASLKPTYLERMERWDEMREQKQVARIDNASSSSQMSTAILPPMRRPENDFVVEQTHDVVAWLQVCELALDGTYLPVPVISHGTHDPGVFSLHQGLQRRIVLFLSSNSGLQLPWQEFTKIRIGNVRLLDAKGRMHDSSSQSMATLHLLKEQNVEFKPDGTGILSCAALWDSSVHNSSLLNRVTSPNHRIVLQLAWLVAVETCSEPIHFSMDMAISMQTRDAGPPSKILHFFGSNKILLKTSTLFNVRLFPQPTRSAKDLWRVDTSEKYVRGEEVLGTWKPRGISVVEDYTRLITTERRAADVQAIRVILAGSPPKSLPADSLAWRADDLLRKALQLWQKQFGHRGKVSRQNTLYIYINMLQIILSQEPCETNSPSSSKQSVKLDPLHGLKLISEAKVVPRRSVSY
jgi:kinesin family protein 1